MCRGYDKTTLTVHVVLDLQENLEECLVLMALNEKVGNKPLMKSAGVGLEYMRQFQKVVFIRVLFSRFLSEISEGHHDREHRADSASLKGNQQ